MAKGKRGQSGGCTVADGRRATTQLVISLRIKSRSRLAAIARSCVAVNNALRAYESYAGQKIIADISRSTAAYFVHGE